MKEYKGWMGKVILDEVSFVVERSGKNHVFCTYEDLYSVEIKKAKIVANGYIRIITRAGKYDVYYTVGMQDLFNELFRVLNGIISETKRINKENKMAQVAQEVAPKVVSQSSIADELLKFKQLYDAGVITLQEFEDMKRQLLRS